MADIFTTTDATIYSKDGIKAVDVITDGSVERLAVDSKGVINIFSSGSTAEIFKRAAFTATSRTETDVAGVTHTVATGKDFYITWFGATGDSPAPMTFRVKVNGVTEIQINLGTGGGGPTNTYSFGIPTKIATAGQIVKVTVEPQYKNATGWVAFMGTEINI